MAEENSRQEENKKERKRPQILGAPAWMVTYSDMVTLLLTFFVLLLSMASLDPVRFTEASNSIKDAFGVHTSPAHVKFAIPILPSPPITKYTPIQQAMTTRVYEKVKSQLDLLNMSDDIQAIQQDSDTIILRVNDSILFEAGESTVSPKSFPVLRNLADIIRPLPMRLRIEGHTDDITTTGILINNWDLSVDRAVAVMRFFRQGELLPLDRMSAIGYGPNKPIVPNTDETSRAQNRRVDFVLRLDKLPEKTEQPINRRENVPL